MVNRGTVPAGVQQLRAFPTGCGIPPEQHAVWPVAFAKISSAPSMPTVQELYRSWARTSGYSSELQRLLRTAYDSDNGPASPGHRRSGVWKVPCEELAPDSAFPAVPGRACGGRRPRPAPSRGIGQGPSE